MGCGQSNAKIAVEPNLDLNNNQKAQPQRSPISPVQTSPVATQKNTDPSTTTNVNSNYGTAGVGTGGFGAGGVVTTTSSKPATTNAMPWANKDNELRKKKKKTNKIVVTSKATKNKTSPFSDGSSGGRQQQITTSQFTLPPIEVQNTPATTTETYSSSGGASISASVSASASASTSASTSSISTSANFNSTNDTVLAQALNNKPKLKPVKVKRRKRPRQDGTSTTAAVPESTSEPTLQAEASITSIPSIMSPDLSPVTSLASDAPLDSPEPTPPPPPPEPLVDPARQSDPRPDPSIEKIGPATLGTQTSINDGRFSKGVDGLTQRWGEVEFLLRIPIKNNNDIDVYSRTAYQSILLLQEIERMARDLGVLQGALSRWLMPYDANTSVADQYTQRVVNPNDSSGNVVAVNPIFSNVPIEKRREMTHQLMDLRKLVRVKIADDGDLAQALQAVTDMDAFFRLLVEEAGMKNEIHGVMLPYDLLQAHLTFLK